MVFHLPNPLEALKDAVNNVSNQAQSGQLNDPSKASSGVLNDIPKFPDSQDPRVSIKAKPDDMTRIYGDRKAGTIMRPLHDSNGVIFPYTPTIQVGQSVEYGSYAPTHSIQEFMAYGRTPAMTFTISGAFTAQTTEEAEYCLAVIHFFRTVTKMYFGQGDNLGVTPPILLLNGYGDLMFNNLPILITNYTIELMDNVDYVQVDTLSMGRRNMTTKEQHVAYTTASPAQQRAIANQEVGTLTTTDHMPQTGNNVAWIPSNFRITANVTVQHTPKNLRTFDLDKFRTGESLKNPDANKGGWW